MNYRIRSAASDDSKQLAVLVEQLGYPADERFIRDQLAWFTSRPETMVFVADDQAIIARMPMPFTRRSVTSKTAEDL